ncbi:hypothetical protein [Jejuia pallidilutea]|uniref:Uncharacterized protein n=1 Tax=Jejuia pallidilutea TaxID=504487 RepID=A0A090W4G8_9FLAO|nr:hypothetical protein [Jejuia pallidilutea]GAL68434.1 hypothetical protein JCM19301_77 [Jejuia pallidilutea]GAL71900.1 hypothetical protein JCM19302_407 [Jejuia pallidilutea]GAL89559.1 hypothetical protein JCM19538_541 [Jejuia pallidilutea]
MNLKSKNYTLIVVVFIIGCTLSVYLLFKYKSPNERELIIDYYNLVEDKVNKATLHDIPLINEERDTISISQLVGLKKLIYRISDLHCNSCVLNEFENLKSILSKYNIESNNIVIIGFYQNLRHLKIFRRINRLENFEIYNLLDSNIGLEADILDMPYFFVLNKNLSVESTFIPTKDANQKTQNYLISSLNKVKSSKSN